MSFQLELEELLPTDVTLRAVVLGVLQIHVDEKRGRQKFFSANLTIHPTVGVLREVRVCCLRIFFQHLTLPVIEIFLTAHFSIFLLLLVDLGVGRVILFGE
uniref:Uncharacterized protein n=1 Tax=Strombidium inclinatum TaxID=197538 RepID=A0A7S3N0Z2_9SPIT